MRTQIIISSTDVEKLKQKARKLKKDSGISHHEALDQVAKSAGFNHWHHVSESLKSFEPTEHAYYFGVIIAMDVKDAMDFRDSSGGFIEDPFAFTLCADDIYAHIREEDDESETTDNDLDYEEDRRDWMQDGLMNFIFFRNTNTKVPESVDEVMKIVNECSFWPPEFIWHKGSFEERTKNYLSDIN